ncbi:MAG: MinD/ParA family protein [Acidobacteriota bacterium]|nr:MinD/ParA family protein [Acidobacteriota bacterium]MDQ7088964.1 MinD/ParA family protein [Acidobacteriota bacterium]
MTQEKQPQNPAQQAGKDARRRLTDRAARTLTLAITSGKGGVGKTSVVANLAFALARKGLRVTLLDADLGLANLDVLLGMVPKKTIEHFFAEGLPLTEIVQQGPLGVRIIPAGSGLPELTALSPGDLYRFVDQLRGLREDCDVLLIDTAAGISDQVTRMLLLADRVLLVTWPEPTALVDAYASLKVALRHRLTREVGLVVNGARSEEEARRVHHRLATAAQKFLGRVVDFDGWIALDEAVAEAARRQRAVVLSNPFAPASRCFERLAATITTRVEGRMRGAVDDGWRSDERPAQLMH